VARKHVGGITAASSVITFADLSGVTIISSIGTATPTVSGNTIIFSTGSDGYIEDLILSDGTHLTFEGNMWNVSPTGQDPVSWVDIDLLDTLTNTTTGLYSHNLIKGFGRGVEELTDGDMEAAGTSAWELYNNAIAKDSGVKHSGTQSLKLAGSAGSSGIKQTYSGQRPRILSGWVKCNAANAGQALTFYLGGGAATNITLATMTEDWQFFTAISPNIDYSKILLACFSNQVGGEIWLDDLTFKEAYVPRLSDDSGWAATVTEEFVAGYWNNIAPVSFLFPQTFMDRSNATIWNAACRASIFSDARNPTLFHASELNIHTLSGYLETAYNNQIFDADNAYNYIYPLIESAGAYVYAATGEELSRSQNLLIYDTPQVDPVLFKIIMWIITTGRRGM